MARIEFLDDCIFEGTVSHQRFIPFYHSFTYKLAYIWIDLKKPKKLRLFKFNSLSLFSIFEQDYGSNKRVKTQKLADYISLELSKHNVSNISHIKLLSLPRIANYVFNPISVFVCFDSKKNQKAIIFEVSNTFGEKHAYLVNLEKIKENIKKKKVFHVSPFFEIKGDYHFFFILNKKTVNLKILYLIDGEKHFSASFIGRRYKLTDRKLVLVFLRKIFQNILVTLGIHIQALKLRFKGAMYINKPNPPKNFFDGESSEKTFK